ncbi:hypothetical protein DOTSEDRAFT_73870 [Dothistroma septosporum NZE10]|uniref:B3/B4 tRNA-binding domain-containing protein n=1 Tax=Dothistroma septosporum (strain NZE10 / CBS 128990) TaxID=675120 RepID=N1PG45_DOTSN|nr:hypothetical protein DOTSEDRAFT_73870 [Dothistroma septosporum NZE10]
MTPIQHLQAYLDQAGVAPEVFELRPDYRALLIAVDGIPPGASNDLSASMLVEAEEAARTKMTSQPVTEISHVAAWREAYKAFGAKPAKSRNSLEALTRRVTPTAGLPRVNRLTDIHNAICVKHQIPLGGEDLGKYTGPPKLIRATGREEFEVMAGGQTAVEHPDVGEVVWCDDKGVTCWRWNWRQGLRTALDDDTTHVLFICDALDPFTDEELQTVADEPIAALEKLTPELLVAHRTSRKP